MRSRWRSLQQIRERVRHRLSHELLRAGSWGLIDQAIVSGTNFVVMLTAARLLGPADFGVFAILITILAFMETSQRSLITTPHNVLGVNRAPDDYPAYTSSVAVGQLGLACLFSSATVLAALVTLQFNRGVGLMVAAMALAAFGWQMHEFTRRVLYTESRISAAVIVDITTYTGRLALVGLLLLSNGLTGASLMLVYGVSWVAGGSVGFWSIRKSLVRRFDPTVLTEHWSFGRWLFASSAVAHLPSYAIAALLSAVLSVAAFGAYRAFDQLANSTNVPLSALSNVLRPRIARRARAGPRSAWAMVWPVMLLGGVILTLFAILYVIFREPLVELVYGPEYVAFAAAVILVAFRPLLTLQKSMLTKALQAMRDTRSVFVGTVLGAIAGTPIGAILVILFELPAAGAVVIVSSLITILWFARAWRQYLVDDFQWQSDPEPKSEVATTEQPARR